MAKLREQVSTSATHDTAAGEAERFDLDALLHPARVFARPSDVVNDPTLSLAEKRAILASWASDACAVEAMPALRAPPGAAKPVAFDEVMDALRVLDGAPQAFLTGHRDGVEKRSVPRSLRRRLRIPNSIAIASRRRSGSGGRGLDA